MEEPIEIATSRDDSGTATIALDGELDLHAATALTVAIERLDREGLTRVQVDAAGLTFVDSSGLRALLQARSALEDDGVGFLVVNVSGSVDRVLDITGTKPLLMGD